MRNCLLVLVCLPLLSGCAYFRAGPTLPDSLLVRDQLVIRSDFKLPQKHRLLEELLAIRGDLVAALDIPISDEPIHLYLFNEAETYREFIESAYPGLPSRRAFFVEGDTRLTVFAHWGDRVAEDLRHEVAHGYLHAVTPNMPLWLDEGLAEHFEVPRGYDGYHADHAAKLLDLIETASWRPDLLRLERLGTISDMAQKDYAEAWLWVHFLLHTSRERKILLQHHLALLREHGQSPPLSEAIWQTSPAVDDDLIAYLRLLAS
ncbi:MAG: hypothetical protein QGG71_25200 [Pirellulaceae bacterium]|nr:hypothetical protein [Pirellulaceae bacterium]